MRTLGARAAPLISVLFGQGLVSLSSFVTVLVLGRWAGESALGSFALGWSGWFLAASLADALIATPYTFFLHQKQRLVPDLGMVALWGVLALGATLALLLGVGGLANHLVINGGGALSTLAALWPALPLALFSSLLREIARRHFMASHNTAQLLLLDVSSSLLQIAAMAALAWGNQLSASNALWAIAGTMLLPLLPMINRDRLQRLWAARSHAIQGLVAFLSYGRWLVLGGTCHVLNVQAYLWLAFAAGGERLSGLYAACMALVNLLSPVLTGLSNYFRPRFMAERAQHGEAALAPIVWKRMPIFVLPAVVLALALSLFGEWALAKLYGEGYAVAAPALRWFASGTVAVALAGPVQLGLLALRSTRSNVLYHGTALITLAAGAALAAGRPGLETLGVINCLAYGLAAVLLLGLFLRETKQGRA